MIVKTYDEDDEITVHRLPLMMMGGVVAISVLMTSMVSFGVFERSGVPSEIRAEDGTKQTASRPIQFFDEADGTVRVEDAASGAVLGEFGPGKGGFIRQTARALVHKRRINGIGAETGFELIEWDDGALTLRDSTTEETIELASFGADNRAVFAAILHKGTK